MSEIATLNKERMDKENAPELYKIWDEARNHIESGNYDKAIEIYKYILVRYGDDEIAAEHANAYLGDLFLTLRQLDEAEGHIKKAIGYSSEKAEYHYILGFVYSNRSEWKSAIKEFEIAVARQPENAEYLRGVGWVMCQSDDRDVGLKLLLKANELSPENANILTDLAVAYLAEDFKQAKAYAEQAVNLDPENELAREVLKRIRIAEQDIKQFLKDTRSGWERASKATSNTHFIHRYKVSLKDNPDTWRTIDIKGNQMLSTLHKAIFKAFDRYDEHEYSFFLKNIPYDSENEYTSVGLCADGNAKPASRIRIDSVELYGGRKFLYLFDYGDEWWHNVELMSVTPRVTRAKYPRVVKKQGKSPPQYPRP